MKSERGSRALFGLIVWVCAIMISCPFEPPPFENPVDPINTPADDDSLADDDSFEFTGTRLSGYIQQTNFDTGDLESEWTEWGILDGVAYLLQADMWYVGALSIEPPEAGEAFHSAEITFLDSSDASLIGIKGYGIAEYNGSDACIDSFCDLVLAFAEIGFPAPESMTAEAVDVLFSLGYTHSEDNPQGGFAIDGYIDSTEFRFTSGGGWNHVSLADDTIRVLMGWVDQEQETKTYLQISPAGALTSRSTIHDPGDVSLAVYAPWLESDWGDTTFPADSGTLHILENSSDFFAASWSVSRTSTAPFFQFDGMVFSGPAGN